MLYCYLFRAKPSETLKNDRKIDRPSDNSYYNYIGSGSSFEYRFKVYSRSTKVATLEPAENSKLFINYAEGPSREQ